MKQNLRLTWPVQALFNTWKILNIYRNWAILMQQNAHTHLETHKVWFGKLGMDFCVCNWCRNRFIMLHIRMPLKSDTGIILCMGLTNARSRYNVTVSLIGWGPQCPLDSAQSIDGLNLNISIACTTILERQQRSRHYGKNSPNYVYGILKYMSYSSNHIHICLMAS